MKKIIIPSVFIFIVMIGLKTAFSQDPLSYQFEYQFGGPNDIWVRNMLTDNDGNVVFLVSSYESEIFYQDSLIGSGYRAYIIKMDGSGNIINRFGFSSNEKMHDVNIYDFDFADNGDLIVAGYALGNMDFGDTTYYLSEFTGFVCRLHSDFTPGSIKFFNFADIGVIPRNLSVCENGDICISGISKASTYFGPDNDTIYATSGTFKMPVWKLDADFNLQWLKVFYADGTISGNQYISLIDQQSNLIVSSKLENNKLFFDDDTIVFNGDTHIIFIKISLSGDIQWIKSADGDFDNNEFYLHTSDNDIYFTSTFKNTITYDNTNISTSSFWKETLILKINSNGELQWYNKIRSTAQNYPQIYPDEILFNNGSLYLTGNYHWDILFDNILLHNISGNLDNYLVKIDDNTGNFVWAQGFYGFFDISIYNFTFTFVEPDIFFAAIPFKDEGTFGNSTFQSYGNSVDVCIAKLKETNIGIDNNNINTDFTVFPNPGTDKLFFDAGYNSGMILLFDHTGKIVFEKKFNTAGTKSINTGSLPAGLYIYKLTDENGNTTNGKWIKKQ